MANRLKEKYLNEVVPALTEQFNYSSVMAVPKVDKIVLNMGVGALLPMEQEPHDDEEEDGDEEDEIIKLINWLIN